MPTSPGTNSKAGPAAPTTLPSDGLTGFGATTTAWDTSHTADQKFDAGTSFMPLVTTTGQQGVPEYAQVMYGSDGRVVSYDLQLPDGTTLTVAKAIVAQQLPADAKLASTYHGTFADGGACLFLSYKSPTLAKALKVDGDTLGVVGVELYSLSASGSDTFVTSDVNVGLLDMTSPTPSGC